MRTFVLVVLAFIGVFFVLLPLLGLIGMLISIGFGILATVFGALISIPLALMGFAVGAATKVIGFIFSALFWALILGVVVWLVVRFFQTRNQRPSTPVEEMREDLHDFREGVDRMRKRVSDLETILREEPRH